MKAPRNVALAPLAAMLMTLVVPLTPASADQGDTLSGGCGFDTNQNDILTNGQNEGVIYVTAVSEEASGTPSTATVACWIDVNGVEQPGTRLTSNGNGVIAGEQQISYSSIDGDVVAECQEVVFADGSTWTAADGNVGVDCGATVSIAGPPLLDIVCPIYVLLYAETGGGVLGVLRIHGDGDLWLANLTGRGYTRVWDCPPYGNAGP